MPKIIINEDENVKSLPIAQDVTVLVPLFLKPGSERSDGEKILYKAGTESKFIEAFDKEKHPDDKRSYKYIRDLISAGLSVLVLTIKDEGVTNLDIGLNTKIYNGLYEEFKSKNSYDIKYITTGAHKNLYLTDSSIDGCYDKIAKLAKYRGDCIALVEFGENESIDNVIAITKNILTTVNEYSVSVFPWGNFKKEESTDEYDVMPASYCYLLAVANNTGSDWLANAGVERGYVPGLISPVLDINDSQAETLLDEDGSLKSVSVNPIMNIRGYGYRIWGNRVMNPGADNLTKDTYKKFLNVRILMCDIKKQLYSASNRIMFDPNDNITWTNFKYLCNYLLDNMVNNRGLEYYYWTKQTAELKGQLKARLTIKPIEAIENISMTVLMTDSDLSVNE